jgi:hypothetical protein
VVDEATASEPTESNEPEDLKLLAEIPMADLRRGKGHIAFGRG